MRAGFASRVRGVELVAALLFVPVAVAAAGVSAAPPTGDVTAIRFFKERADAYAELSGVKIVQTGYFSMRRGRGSSVDYTWGRRTPAGYVPARATIFARLGRGRIVAYLAELRAPGVRKLRVLMAGGHVYTWTTSCWRKQSASASPLGTGERYLFNDGGVRYLPLSRRGTRTTVTFTYQWVPGARARETSAFATGKAPRVTVTIRVTGAQKLTFRKELTPLRKAPKLPVPEPPGLPVPKPVCLV